ncbi:MAG: hypothetical protein ACREJX_11260, partial [Polyangiaceae bacterium]
MTTSAPTAPPAEKTGRHQRSMKNYLIDSRFQLKYTSFIILIALAISSVLGSFLYDTSRDVVAESQQVVNESKKVSDIVKMTIKEQYADTPELGDAFAQS